MGDNMREVSDPRGRGRDTTSYSQCEIDAIGVRQDHLQACDQIGMALSRWDASEGELRLSRLAAFFLGSEAETFTQSDLFAKILSTSDVDAQWDYTLESGRVIRLRRAGSGAAPLVTFHDVTLEADSREVIARSGQLKVGYIQRNLSSKRHLIFGDFLDKMLSSREQLELRKAGFRSLVHPRSRERFDADMTALQDRSIPVDRIYEFTCQRFEAFYLQLQLFPLESSSGKIVKLVGAFRDVTSERQSQAELVRLRNEFAADAEARQFMVARFANEIRTPLSGVVGLAQFMSQTQATDLPQDVVRQLGVLRKAAEDALAQINALASSGSGHMATESRSDETVDLRALVQDISLLWNVRAVQAGLTMSVRVAENVPSRTRLDDVKLRHCLNTLLSKAVTHATSGNIGVGCAVSKSDNGNWLIVGVRSGSGKGGDAMSISDPVERAVLGRMIAEMGGKFELNASSNRSTTATLLLPLHVGEVEPEGSAQLVDSIIARQPGVEPSPYKDLRVLAVDDNAINGQVIEQLLRGRVASVKLAANGRQALDNLAKDDFDIVLMDIHMPVMDGIEATLAIRSSRQSFNAIPIVALTADSDYQQKRVAVNLGMDAALAKPVTLSKLLHVFDSLGLASSVRKAA